MMKTRLRTPVNARILGLMIFLAGMALASDCHAQRMGWRWQRGQRPQMAPRTTDYRIAPQAPPVFPAQQYNQRRNNLVSRILDPPGTSAYRDPAEVDSRYIGGFHRSQFDNIGLPSGDIGLRGNGLYWRPW